MPERDKSILKTACVKANRRAAHAKAASDGAFVATCVTACALTMAQSAPLSGAVDTVLSIKRMEGQNNPNVRVIESISRFDSTPDRLTVELTQEGYISHGTFKRSAVEEASDQVMPLLPLTEADALTIDDLCTQADLHRSTAQRALDDLVTNGRVVKIGGGKKGDPFRYHSSEILSAQTTTVGGWTDTVSRTRQSRITWVYQKAGSSTGLGTTD